MARNKVSLVLLVAFAASATGLLLAVHLHQVHGHDSHHCDLCVALVRALPAVVEQPQATVIGLVVARSALSLSVWSPFMRIAHGATTSRAPPLA